MKRRRGGEGEERERKEGENRSIDRPTFQSSELTPERMKGLVLDTQTYSGDEDKALTVQLGGA